MLNYQVLVSKRPLAIKEKIWLEQTWQNRKYSKFSQLCHQLVVVGGGYMGGSFHGGICHGEENFHEGGAGFFLHFLKEQWKSKYEKVYSTKSKEQH